MDDDHQQGGIRQRSWGLVILMLSLLAGDGTVAQPIESADEDVSPAGLVQNTYAWDWDSTHATPLDQRFPPPNGFSRVDVRDGSFGSWLRTLPLRPKGTPVRLHTGTLKPAQQHHAAVIDIDCGSRNLQQCADAVIRLHAEYLYGQGPRRGIAYRFTSGDTCRWDEWRHGVRPVVEGAAVRFVRTATPDSSYRQFRWYLNTVFTYAGTLSLARDLSELDAGDPVLPGDVYVQGGSPGHAVLVLDVAVHRETGAQVMLLAQSFMPAQDIHVLVNPDDPDLSPWYRVGEGARLRTPEWTFCWTDRKRWPDL